MPTIWSMVYDLNRIIRYADKCGKMQTTPQRACVSIMDATHRRRGNGPLQPLPVATGIVIAADDPFELDMVMARLMSFDYRKIPILRQQKDFGDCEWGNFEPPIMVMERGCISAESDSGKFMCSINRIGRFTA